ncbi:MAG: GvpL/GvpF family gas vesicle protein [Ignavibacteriales bacterium]|nr:GvpL/GvpF family gas vesicle protein [Ignavibacteriales bacterium]
MEKVGRKQKITHEDTTRVQLATSHPLDGARNGVYAYCIFYGREYAIPLRKGIDNGENISSVKYEDIEALISHVSLSEYNEESLKEKLEDVGWIVPRAQAHERIIESVMEFCAVIPIKFCTIFKDESKVSETLRQNYEAFKSLLDYLADKQEWGIKIYVDCSKISQVLSAEISSEAPQVQSTRSVETLSRAAEGSSAKIRELDEQLSVASEGAAYFLRKKRDDVLKERSEEIVPALAEEIYEKLQPWAVDSRRNQLLSRSSTGRSNDMMLNVALLLTTSAVADFKMKIDRLAAGYGSKGFLFELSGPWPPHNFCGGGMGAVH